MCTRQKRNCIIWKKLVWHLKPIYSARLCPHSPLFFYPPNAVANANFSYRRWLLVCTHSAFYIENAAKYAIKLRFNFALRNALCYDIFLQYMSVCVLLDTDLTRMLLFYASNHAADSFNPKVLHKLRRLPFFTIFCTHTAWIIILPLVFYIV